MRSIFRHKHTKIWSARVVSDPGAARMALIWIYDSKKFHSMNEWWIINCFGIMEWHKPEGKLKFYVSEFTS